MAKFEISRKAKVFHNMTYVIFHLDITGEDYVNQIVWPSSKTWSLLKLNCLCRFSLLYFCKKKLLWNPEFYYLPLLMKAEVSWEFLIIYSDFFMFFQGYLDFWQWETLVNKHSYFLALVYVFRVEFSHLWHIYDFTNPDWNSRLQIVNLDCLHMWKI